MSQTLSDLRNEFELPNDSEIVTIIESSFVVDDEIIGIGKSDSTEWSDERIFEFDADGNLVKIAYYYPPLIPYRTWEYLSTNTEPMLTGLRKYTREFRYEEPGKINWESTSVGTAEKGLDQGEQDRSEIKTRIQYKYDSRGVLREKIEEAQNGNMIGAEYFEYRDNLWVRYTKGDFSIEDWCEFKYDAYGDLIQKNCSRPGAQLRKVISYRYDEGILTETLLEVFKTGVPERTVKWSFSEGYANEMTQTNGDGETIERLMLSYAFDPRGNWILKKMKSQNFTYIISREIKYRE